MKRMFKSWTQALAFIAFCFIGSFAVTVSIRYAMAAADTQPQLVEVSDGK